MKLIVGLGNPGPEFTNTRHNVGFAVVEALAASQGLVWQHKDKFKADVAEGTFHGEKIMLAKPITYYNLAGESVRAIKDFFKVDDQDTLVVHDELDLPFGTVRARIGGSDAGNNGMKSIIAHGGESVARVRIGIANNHLATTDAADFVLGKFSADEAQKWPSVLQASLDMVSVFIDSNQKFGHTSVRISE